MAVAVNLVCFVDEMRDVLYGRNFCFAVQFLSAFELLEWKPALFGVPEFAKEGREWVEIVNGEVVADVDRVGTQEVAQEGYLHGLPLDIVENWLVEVACCDAIVD